MTIAHIALLLLCVLGIAAGQIFFKMGALAFAGKSFAQLLTGMLSNPMIIAGLLVYGISTVLWIWLLRYVPLNRAYPFMAFAFVLVPLASWALLGERVDSRYFAGVALIMAGLLIIGK